MIAALTAFWLNLQAAWPNISLVLGGLWLLYVVLLSAWIILQKRAPVATLSWLLSLILLPYIGFLIYHFLGPTRIKRQNLKRGKATAGLSALNTSCGIETPTALMRLNQASSGYAASSAERVQLLINGAATYAALETAFVAAQHHIHLEYYIFEPDTSGTQLRDALVVAAKRGVKVRLLLDRLGSKNIQDDFLAPLRAAGAEVLFFHAFRFKHLWRPQINIRSHRKIVIIDGDIGFTGGINITDTENESVRADAYVDLHFRVDGDVVRWLQLAFMADWLYTGGKIKAASDYFPEAPAACGAIAAQVLAAGPDTPWEPIHRAQIAAINGAEKRVLLVSPYFVPSEAALMALSSAALRGVDTALVVPKRSDSRVVTLAARSYFEELASAGVRIYEYPDMLHTKALLVDDGTVILGSSNFDHRSFRLNFELSMLFENAELGDQTARILYGYLGDSQRFDPKAPINLGQRLAQAGARLFSPLL
jgi:cardiolipin synthase A/B